MFQVFNAQKLVCAAICSVGAVGVMGWVLGSPALLSYGLGITPVDSLVFDTGLCLCLCGTALSLIGRHGVRPRWTRTVLAVGLILFCSVVFAEFLFDQSFGVDFDSLHAWYDSGIKNPGRMAPNTAVGFMLIGCAIVLADRVTTKLRALAAVILAFCVLGIGLTGLVCSALAPDLLFQWSRSARMAIPTAMGLILCSGALRLTWSESSWYSSHRYFREDEKIRLLGPATIVVVAVTAALFGFVLQQNAFQKILADNLKMVLQARTALLVTTIQQGSQNKLTMDRLSLLAETGGAIVREAAPAARHTAEAMIEAQRIAAGIRGIRLDSLDGAILAEFGAFGTSPPITAPLNTNDTFELMWDGEFVLRTRLPLMDNGNRVGSMIVDQSADYLAQALFDVANLGQTGEIAACLQSGMELLCFPGSRHKSSYAVPLPTAGKRLPMQLALAGQTGDGASVDYRGQNVIAAYGLLAPGLGFVVKEDAVELYAGIRQALQVGTPLLAVVALLGAMILYLELKPLTAQMLASESRAKERELQMRALVGSVAEGILTIDEQGLIEEANPATCEIFGYQPAELIGSSTSMLLPTGSHTATHGRLHRAALRGLAVLAGQRNVKLSGRRKDGSEFALEVTITAASFAGRCLFVGVVRDITERMEGERKLTALSQYDSLTGLPNRSLFFERLTAIATRRDGISTAIALMFIDLDGFKEINDTFGHRCGDDLLIQFARRLSASVRDSDMVSRLAGDEFTIILEKLAEPVADAQQVADNIIASLEKPFALSGREVRVTASLGLVIQQGGGFNTSDLLARADAAMYAAKHAGKNRVIAA
jgi:diguanylate cyclase (GGDEF)-like protein/PAS domain S-box-containing protein